MTDQAKLAEIRKRHVAAMVGDGEEPRPLTEEDWTFIEHAWLDVGYLLSELDRKDEEARKLREEMNELLTWKNGWLSNAESINAEIASLRKNLQYAQQEIDHYKNGFQDAVYAYANSIEREQKLIDALISIKPFVEIDFPEGPDLSKNCATTEYRAAYRKMMEALIELGVTEE